MKALPLFAALALVLVSSCDFDGAFRAYCANNDKCGDAAPEPDIQDAASPPDVPSQPDLSAREDTPPDLMPAVPLIKSCGGSNGDCGPEEICHPWNQVCMRKCNSDLDCPLSLGLDTCEEIQTREPISPERLKICRCSSARACNSVASNLTCSPEDKLCEPLCEKTEDCAAFSPARECDKLKGVCKRPCYSNRDCYNPAEPRCDFVSMLCTDCTSQSDCANRPDNLTQCSSTGACVRP